MTNMDEILFWRQKGDAQGLLTKLEKIKYVADTISSIQEIKHYAERKKLSDLLNKTIQEDEFLSEIKIGEF